jgi:endonuclease YncB( thermonuclease family)
VNLLLFLLVSPLLLIGEELVGRVIGVTDGDTITVLVAEKPTTVRLNGIDCPEGRQAFGTKAKEFTAALAAGKTVTVAEKGKDRYGRVIGDVTLPDGRSLNRELVKAGMAWWYRKYAPSDWLLKELEADAHFHRRGLWADASPVPPWEWRKPSATTGAQ